MPRSPIVGTIEQGHETPTGLGRPNLNPIRRLQNWWQAQTGEENAPLEGDAPAWLISLVVHISVLILLAATFIELPQSDKVVELTAVPLLEDFQPPTDFAYSDLETKEIGANSVNGLSMAEGLGQVEQEVPMLQAGSVVEAPQILTDLGDISIQKPLLPSESTELDSTVFRQGAAGTGVTGAAGAVDRITREILDSLDQRKTLIVWFFDQSLSLSGQREAIYKRLDRIYEELGVVEASQHPAFAKHDDKPLLTSVVAFGKEIHLLTSRPTDQLSEIKSAVNSIKNDDSGVERTFEAVCREADEYKRYANNEKTKRNIMFIIFTDETGDDGNETTGKGVELLDQAVSLSRHYGIRNYVVGIPSPFGRKDVEVKWIDPDPRYNQEPQWTTVTQGPETLLPERVKIAFTGGRRQEEPLDSGFGPYNLTRLAVATGGIYFTVHPNRNPDRPVSRAETSHLSSYIKYFFDANVMRKYRPDYVTAAEYKKRLQGNRAKRALVDASGKTWVSPITNPQLRFRRRDEADLARQLSEAQQQAAKLEPKVRDLQSTLMQGKNDREKITELRWQAGYDLAMGQVMALKVRTEGYNTMLAKAKRGMKFQNSKNDTWDLVGSKEVTSGSALEKEAKLAEFYLNRVVEQHPGTPWAMVAAEELADPLGWQWRETFTNVNPPRVAQPNNNNPPRPRDDKRNMIPPKVTRQPPKL